MRIYNKRAARRNGRTVYGNVAQICHVISGRQVVPVRPGFLQMSVICRFYTSAMRPYLVDLFLCTFMVSLREGSMRLSDETRQHKNHLPKFA